MLQARARRVARATRELFRRAAATPKSHLTNLPTPPAQQRSFLAEESVSEGVGPTTAVVTTEDLHEAIRQENLQLVQYLLHRQRRCRGAAATAEAVNSVASDTGDACIHVAAKFGHAEVISLLLQHGAQTNHVGSQSRTPLQLASIYGHLQAVEVLLDAGADANASLRDASGYEHVSQCVSRSM